MAASESAEGAPARESRREARLQQLGTYLYVGAIVGAGVAVVSVFVYLLCDAWGTEGMSTAACMEYAGVLSVIFSRGTIIGGAAVGAVAGLAAYELRKILRHERGLTGDP
jgi:hypothetical protein